MPTNLDSEKKKNEQKQDNEQLKQLNEQNRQLQMQNYLLQMRDEGFFRQVLLSLLERIAVAQEKTATATEKLGFEDSSDDEDEKD